MCEPTTRVDVVQSYDAGQERARAIRRGDHFQSVAWTEVDRVLRVDRRGLRCAVFAEPIGAAQREGGECFVVRLGRSGDPDDAHLTERAERLAGRRVVKPEKELSPALGL